jgi:hypothetical protein
VSKAFFEFARPAAPPRPRWAIQTVHRGRHLFREHCEATQDPMLIRMGGGAIARFGGDRRAIRMVSRLGAVSRNPRAWRGLPNSSSGSVPG